MSMTEENLRLKGFIQTPDGWKKVRTQENEAHSSPAWQAGHAQGQSEGLDVQKTGSPTGVLEPKKGKRIRQSSKHENHHQTPGSKPQPPICHESLAAEAGETGHTNRIHVGVTSYRQRLIDPDNLCPKYFIDCLRYAGIIPNDRAQDIILTVLQRKVASKAEERTEIEITP